MAALVRLTDAQQSALECAGLGETERYGDELATLAAAWKGRTLVVSAETRDTLFSELTDLSNGEDEDAQRTGNQFAARASRSLAAVASKVLRIER